MECWSNGVMGGEKFPNTPALHYSNWKLGNLMRR